MKKFSFFSLIFIAIMLCTCISSGYFLSSVILSSRLFQTTSQISCETTTFYALSLYESNKREDLLPFINNLQSSNGAGHLFKQDNIYHIITSIYNNVNDAELVKNNLKLNNYESKILEIKVSQCSIEGNFENQEKEILQKCFKINNELYNCLYDVAISLDTSVIDKTKAKLDCNTIYSNFIATKTNFETFFKSDNLSEDLTTIANQLNQTDKFLSDLIAENYETSSQTFSSLIKLTYCKILLSNM